MTTSYLATLATELATGPVTLLAADMRVESTIDALASLYNDIDPQAFDAYLGRDPIIGATVAASRDALDSRDDVASLLVERVRALGPARDAYDVENANDDLHFTVDDLSDLADARLSDIGAYVTRDSNDPSYLVVTTAALDVVVGELSELDVECVAYDATGEPQFNEWLAREFLTRDPGRAPGSRYGQYASDMADVVIAAARSYAFDVGEPITFDLLDYLLGLAVNDSDDVARLVVESDPSLGIVAADLLDTDTLGRYLLDACHNACQPIRQNEREYVLGDFDTYDPYASTMAVAFALNDASYVLGEATDETYRPSPLLNRASLDSDEYDVARFLVLAVERGIIFGSTVGEAVERMSSVVDTLKRLGFDG